MPEGDNKVVQFAPKAPAPGRTGLICNGKGEPLPIEANVIDVILAEPRWRGLYTDMFLRRMRLERDGKTVDWSDDDHMLMHEWLQREGDFPRVKFEVTKRSVRAVANARSRDSLTDFYISLPAWDQVERIATALEEAWGCDGSDVVRAASTNLFRSMAARAIYPGAKVDTITVFEGPQGTLKSQSMQVLGGQYYAEISAPIGSADFMREIRSINLGELSELNALHGRESQTIKTMLSRTEDRFVEKYEAEPRSYPRRCVFIGTTNETQYWDDATGARRLVPVRVGAIDLRLIAENRLQWLAEALADIREGRTWHEWPGEIGAAQDERQHGDPWEDELRHVIAHGRQSGTDMQGVIDWPIGWISSREILFEWLRVPPAAQARAYSTRLGRVMRRLGFRPGKSSDGNERGWRRDD
jgi:predicted P-loop ATPase